MYIIIYLLTNLFKVFTVVWNKPLCIMGTSNYLNEQERAALLNGGFAFQYWNGGVSALYEGQDAVDFAEQHFDANNDTIPSASICFGNHPKIVDAYDCVMSGGALFCDGIGIGDEITYYGEHTDGVHKFPAFV